MFTPESCESPPDPAGCVKDCCASPQPLSDFPAPVLSVRPDAPGHKIQGQRSPESQGPEETSQEETLLRVIANMERRLITAERAIHSLTSDRDQLRHQVHQLQQRSLVS